MAERHRRHGSLDTFRWLYTNRPEEPPAPAQNNRSISTRVSNCSGEVFPAIKRQNSVRFNPGEYFTGCFGPLVAKTSDLQGSEHALLLGLDSAGSERTRKILPPRSRSLSTTFLGNFNFGSMRVKDNYQENPSSRLERRATELNQKAASDKNRVLQLGGRWVLEEDDEYYLKPPAWKQVLRKWRAEAKRHVHPVPNLERMTNYDPDSYEKNFDDGSSRAIYMVVDEDDKLEVRARVLHTNLLARLHSHRFEDALGQQPSAKLLKSTSMPVVPVNLASKVKDDSVPIWQRRSADRPLPKLELTRSF